MKWMKCLIWASKQIDVFFRNAQREQNILFSATMMEDVEVIIDEEFDVPQVVEAASGTRLETIRHELYVMFRT